MTATNTAGAVPTTLTAETEDHVMAALPEPIRRWLREEAVSDLSVVEPFRWWRQGVPVDRIMAHLRGEQRRRTRADLGATHPQASAF